MCRQLWVAVRVASLADGPVGPRVGGGTCDRVVRGVLVVALLGGEVGWTLAHPASISHGSTNVVATIRMRGLMGVSPADLCGGHSGLGVSREATVCPWRSLLP